MKFLGLDLIAFGPFTNRSLDFPAKGPRFHVIFGPNEAGKSTSLRAITGFLYGIDARTTDAHLHSMVSLRIGARLQLSNGEELAFIRRKGLRDTLLNPQEKPVDDAALRACFNGINREQFGDMFGLDHDRLRLAGESLARGKGDAGESLFGASLGNAALHERLRKLEEEAASLFSAGASKPSINKTLAELKEANRVTKDASLTPAAWKDADAGLEEARQRIDVLVNELNEITSALHRLRRVRTALPRLALRSKLIADRLALGDVPPLPATLRADRLEAQRELREAQTQLVRHQALLARLTAERAAIEIPRALLDSEKEIDALTKRAGGQEKAAGDLPTVRARKLLMEHQQKELLKELGRTIPLDELDSLRVDAVTQARIASLVEEGARSDARLSSARGSLGDKRAAISMLSSQLASSVATPDLTRLRISLSAAQQDRTLDRELQTTISTIESLDYEVRKLQVALQLDRLGVDEIHRRAVPSEEQIRSFEERFVTEKRQTEQLREAREEAETELRQNTVKLDKVRRDGPLPTEAALQGLRVHRDASWQQIRDGWAGARPFDAPVADAFRQAMQEADDVVDTIRRASERVLKHAALLDQQAVLESKLQQLLADQQERERAGQQLEAAWGQLWAPPGVAPKAPREMLRWRTDHEVLLKKLELREAAVHAGDRTRAAIDAHRTALLAALPMAVPSATPLTALLAQAEATIRETDEQSRTRGAREQQLQDAEAERARLEERVRLDESSHQAWQQAWGAAVAPLGLPPDARTSQASAVLERLDKLFADQETRRGYDVRIHAMEGDAQKFTRDALGLATRLAPDLSDAPPERIVEKLNARLKVARNDEIKRQGLDQQCAQAQLDFDESTRRHTTASQRWAELLQTAGCADAAALESAEQLSEQARALDLQRAAVENELLAQSEGVSLAGLEAAAVDQTHETLSAEIERNEARRQELEAERNARFETKGKLEAELSRMTGEDRAAQAMAETQAHLARLRTDSERYARVKLAAAVLKRAIERYRDQNEGPILARASELFQRLTLGRYQKLRTTLDVDDRAVLRCIRDGQEVDIVAALSDGTRDQLFLSLRLASLEHYLAFNEPMPLVLDDIFIHFDDDRARAGIAALAEVSARTQVLLFTHHARTLELAREALADDQWCEHRLKRALPEATPVAA
jgi:uncharacterized protein YhaN